MLLGARTYTVTRRGSVSWVDGLPVQPVATTFDVVASVQPLSGRDMHRAPEGLRTSDARKAYVQPAQDPALRLRTASANGQQADLIEVDGVSYEVHTITPYDGAAPIPHQRAYIHAAQSNDEAEVG